MRESNGVEGGGLCSGESQFMIAFRSRLADMLHVSDSHLDVAAACSWVEVVKVKKMSLGIEAEQTELYEREVLRMHLHALRGIRCSIFSSCKDAHLLLLMQIIETLMLLLLMLLQIRVAGERVDHGAPGTIAGANHTWHAATASTHRHTARCRTGPAVVLHHHLHEQLLLRRFCHGSMRGLPAACRPSTCSAYERLPHSSSMSVARRAVAHRSQRALNRCRHDHPVCKRDATVAGIS